jgi:hypothetical protein
LKCGIQGRQPTISRVKLINVLYRSQVCPYVSREASMAQENHQIKKT